ncbi:MAG: LysM peptidoglycan-binding domain-containing protein [Chloroflexota bacterium]
MPEKEKVEEVIGSYRKRQQWGPLILGSIAVVLLITGALALAIWLTGPDKPVLPFWGQSSPTPSSTPTLTPSPRPTATNTITPPPTSTPTETLTPTLSGPIEYKVEEGDNVYSIAAKFDVTPFVLMVYNNFTDQTILYVGDIVIIPPPDAEIPTKTPLPEILSPGAQIQYRVEPGDMLEAIAIRFNSTVDAILKLNEDLDDPNEIYVGQILIIPVNIVTPVPTATNTPSPTP